MGERALAVLPVQGQELGDLVGPLDDSSQGVGHHADLRVVRLRQPGQLTHQQQRHMTQVVVGTQIDGEIRHVLLLALRDQSLDAVGNGDTVFVEGILPQQTRRHRAPKLVDRSLTSSRPTLVGVHRDTLGILVRLHLDCLPKK